MHFHSVFVNGVLFEYMFFKGVFFKVMSTIQAS